LAIVPSQSFVDGSRVGIIKRQVQCAQSPVHLAEFATRSGRNRLQSSIIGSRD